VGGRGSGKTFSVANNFIDLILNSEPGEWGVVAPTFADGRDIVVAGPSGLIVSAGGKAGGGGMLLEKGPWLESWNVSNGHLRFRNGSIVYIDGADDGALRIQGKNLRGCLCDEIGLWRQWKTAWDESIKYAVRLSPAKILVGGTPKANREARELVKRLIDDPKVPVDRLRTEDNAANLDPDQLEDWLAAKGTRLGRQELEGELLADREGALVTWDDIIPYRVNEADLPAMRRVLVSVDPSFSNTEDSDECGIVAVGEGVDGHGYILSDWSGRYSLDQWAKRAVLLAWLLRANAIVYETNLVGNVVRSNLDAAVSDFLTSPEAWEAADIAAIGLDGRPENWVPPRMIPATAKLPKEGRLEVVAPLWQQHRIHHCTMTDGSGVEMLQEELEGQLTTWTSEDKYSPDRMDACLIDGTLICSHRGLIPIETVSTSDWVMTRDGWCRVLDAGMSCADAEVGRLETTSGDLVGTKNHPVWIVGKGWRRMDAVCQGDTVATWHPLSSQLSTVESLTPARFAARRFLKTSTDLYPELVAASVVKRWSSVGRSPVYNLSVDQTPEYFANGILVHNCTQAVAELRLQRPRRKARPTGELQAAAHAASV
jgi:phage terminase large subunit-like protein